MKKFLLLLPIAPLLIWLSTVTLDVNNLFLPAAKGPLSAPLAPTVSTLYPTADAFVRPGAYANNNYGDTAVLQVKSTASVKRSIYIKFNLAAAADDMVSAKLRLYGKNELCTSIPLTLYATNSQDWTENTVSYDNTPSHAATALAVTSVNNTEKWYEWDITEHIQLEATQDDVASFVLVDESNGNALLNFTSKEGTNKPELVITEPAEPTEPPLVNAVVPTADAFVRADAFASTNYGTDTTLLVKTSTTSGITRHSYLQFDVSTIPDTATTIKLRMYGSNELTSTVPVSCLSTTDGWTETGINYTNKPAGSATALAVTNVTNAKKWYEWNVTSFVKTQMAGDNVASFAMVDKSTINALITLASGEAVLNKPQLTWSTEPADTASLVYAPEHIFVVWEENRNFGEVIGSGNAPYINSLRTEGTVFDSVYGLVGTSSYANYLAVYGGNTNGVTTNDCLGRQFNANTMYTSLSTVGKTVVWYSEDLPADGSEVCESGQYKEKHNPSTAFYAAKSPASVNKRWNNVNWQDTSLYRNMANVVFIVPNQDHDMHDGTVKQGDDWLLANHKKLADWCKIPSNKSIFVVWWDEENSSADIRIPNVFVGPYIKQNYRGKSGKYGHYEFAKWIVKSFDADTTNVNFRTNVNNAKPMYEHLTTLNGY